MAVGNPAALYFFPVDDRHIRLIGRSLGTTDFTLTNDANETLDYEVRVMADLDTSGDHLRDLFPDASLELSQLREKIVVKGQARERRPVVRIIGTIDGYIRSVQRTHIDGQVANRDERGQTVDPALASLRCRRVPSPAPTRPRG